MDRDVDRPPVRAAEAVKELARKGRHGILCEAYVEDDETPDRLYLRVKRLEEDRRNLISALHSVIARVCWLEASVYGAKDETAAEHEEGLKRALDQLVTHSKRRPEDYVYIEEDEPRDATGLAREARGVHR